MFEASDESQARYGFSASSLNIWNLCWLFVSSSRICEVKQQLNYLNLNSSFGHMLKASGIQKRLGIRPASL